MSSALQVDPLVELRLFGKPLVRANGQDVTNRLSKRAVLLLAILALHRGEPVERQKLANLLWPESPDATALHNLRQTLNGLRTELGPAKEVLQSPGPRTLQMAAAPEVQADVWEFNEALSKDNVGGFERCLSLQQQPLLLGCDEPFALQARQEHEEALLIAMEALAALHLVENDAAAAVGILDRALGLDPYRERVARSLMQAYSELAQPLEALELYRRFKNRVRSDLQSDVGQETRELAQSIRGAISARTVKGRPSDPLRRLPLTLAPMIGRVSEKHEIASLLDRGRLVTLSGPGGVGKTRLAIGAAEAAGPQFRDGVAFVDLAAVMAAGTVPTTLARVLALQERIGAPILQTVAEWLAPRNLLLILDNCEHLAGGIAQAVETLLNSAPCLHILATSRQPLEVRGELIYPVEPLAVPPLKASAQECLRSESVQLFVERSARAAAPPDLAVLASICRRLDGLPLAIELAAARTNVLSLKEIEARLRESFDLLAAGPRTLPRHQTLAASMEWSWGQLSEEQQRALARLSVFQGGCTFAAAEAVTDEKKALDILGSLVDRSLVKRASDSEDSRYFLLETVRQFAAEKLRLRGESEEACNRHRDYFLQWAEVGDLAMQQPKERELFERYERDHDNLRAAIAWSHHRGEHDRALELCVYLSRFWDTHGHLSEGRNHLEYSLGFETPRVSRAFRGRARVHAGWMATTQRDCTSAVRHYEEALEIAQQEGDLRSVGRILCCMGNAYTNVGEFGKAREVFGSSLEIQWERGNLPGVATVQSNLAEIDLDQGNLAAAKVRLHEALRAFGTSIADHPEAGGLVLRNLSFVSLREGDILEAGRLACEAVQLFYAGGLLIQLPAALAMLGVTTTGYSPLLGAAQRSAKEQGIEYPSFLSPEVSRAAQITAEAQLEAGRRMDLDQAVQYALKVARGQGSK